jgi:5-methylcytosine-specific restriction endonuclease McrA
MKTCRDCKGQDIQFVKNRLWCIICHRKMHRARYKKNKAARLAKVKQYYLLNKQKKLAYAKQYRKENPLQMKLYRQMHAKEIAEYNSTYRKKNIAFIKIRESLYNKTNKHKVNTKNMLRHTKKLQRTPKWLTLSDYEKIKEYYFYANLLTQVTGIKYNVDHIIPLRGKNISGLHCPENLQIITKKENVIKGNKFPHEKGS